MVPGAVRPQRWRATLTLLKRLAFAVTLILLLLTLVTDSRALMQVEMVSFLSLTAIMIASAATAPEPAPEPEPDPVRQWALQEAYAELNAMDAVAAGHFEEPKEPKRLAVDPEKLRRLREFQKHEDYYKARMEVDYSAKIGKPLHAILTNTMDNTIETWLNGQLVKTQPIKVGYHPREVADSGGIVAYTGRRPTGGASA
jgi:hypothetical protein